MSQQNREEEARVMQDAKVFCVALLLGGIGLVIWLLNGR